MFSLLLFGCGVFISIIHVWLFSVVCFPGALYVIIITVYISPPPQKVKVDTEAAMLEIDQILRANELSISLVAAVPAILIAYGITRGLWRVVTPSAPDPVWEALPARCVCTPVL